MSFPAKVLIGVVAILVIAAAAIFLMSNREEKAIQKLLEQGFQSATKGDAEGVIWLLSPDYEGGPQGRDEICRRIRLAVRDRITPARLDRVAIQVSGDDADASVRVIVGALQLRREFDLRLKLRNEKGGWKVTSAREVEPGGD